MIDQSRTVANPEINAKRHEPVAQPNWPALVVLIALAIFWFPFIPFFTACFSWLLLTIEPVIAFIASVSLILMLPTLCVVVAMLLGGAIPRSRE